jgi:hypothetical protein
MFRRLVWLGLVLAWPAGLRASGSLETRASGGVGTWGAGGTVSVDLDEDQHWSLSGSDDYTSVTETAAPSETDDASLVLSYADGGAWVSKFGLDYSNDSINRILYAGPSFGLSYGEPGDDDGAPDLWTLSIDTSIHGYQVDLGANSIQSKSRAGVPYTLVNNDGILDITQFNPGLTFEVPLFSGWLTPSLGYGHDFYNRDPTLAAQVIARRYTTGSGTLRSGSLVGALYTDTWTAALSVKLFAGWSLEASGTNSLLVQPLLWVQSASVGLKVPVGKSVTASAAWTDSIQGETTAEGWDGTLSLDF